MNPLPRTLAFVVAAVLSVGAAGWTYYSSRPAKVNWDADIGEVFFKEFEDPNKATYLQVATFDKEASKVSTFSVEFKDGKWRIPSHNNYPADGKDRLKQTAASVIGIKRGTLVGKNKEAHKQHNLLDPLDQSINETEGRGDRITLKDGEKPLVDFIIGKKKEGSQNTYYIRRADEDRFYLSEVKIELSTKFSDWIEPDLLGLKRDDVKEIYIDRYQVDESQGAIVPGEKSILTRDNATADWKIDGIDPAAVKPKTSVISAMLGSLDDLKIVGVRRKPEGLSSSLQGDESIKLTNSTIVDLQNHGYFYHPKKGIVSNEGDMLVSTFDGVSYVLRFGEVFEGSDIAVEVGSPTETVKKPADAKSADGEKKDGDKPAEEAKKDEGEQDKAKEVKKNRFVFIMAQHDPRLLGDAPVEPKKPEPPAEEAKPEGEKPAAEAAKDGEKKDGEAAPPAADPNAEAKAKAKADYESALKKYETDSDVYRIKKKEYEEKLASGEKRVKELNARFADWYYVISEDLFEELRVKSADLVEPVAPPETLPNTPPLPTVPATEPAKEEAPPATTPEGEKKPEEKAADPAKPEGEKPADAPAADKPAEPAKPAEGAAPPAEKPAETEKPAQAEKPADQPTEPAKPAEPKP